VLIASTGLRKGEALALRWDKVTSTPAYYASRRPSAAPPAGW
jgi:integrase